MYNKLTVMIKVFEGGVGSTRGGRSERFSLSGDLLPEDARERVGDGISAGCMCVRFVEALLGSGIAVCESRCDSLSGEVVKESANSLM